MRIRHERPDADLAFEVAAPLRLALPDGTQIAVERWSLAGFRVPSDVDVFPTHGTVTVPFQGIDVAFDLKWTEAKDGFAEWRGLTGRQREALALFYNNLLSGKMAAAGDIVTALDTPVDLVPMGETEEEAAQGSKGKAPRALRVLFNSAMYLLAAGVIFGLLGTQIWSRLTSVPIQNARIEAPFHTLLAGGDGYVDRVDTHIGAQVSAGERLVHLSDPKGDSRLEDIRTDIKRVERRITDVETELAQIAAERALIHDFAPGKAELAAQLDKREKVLRQTHEDLIWDLRRLRRDRGNQSDLARALDIIAPVDGRVRDLFAMQDQFLPRGADAVVIEEDAPRLIRGWVNEAHAAALYPGMPMKVTVNLLGERKSYPATIERIEAGADPALPGRYGLLVWARFDGLTMDETRAFLPNAPVKLTAKRELF